MPNTPYKVLEDGRIIFDDRRREKLESMFRTAGIDIATIRTEADYKAAFSRAGDFFFDRLIESAEAGDRNSVDILQNFLEGRFSEAKALVARQTFEVIEGGPDVPPRSA